MDFDDCLQATHLCEQLVYTGHTIPVRYGDGNLVMHVLCNAYTRNTVLRRILHHWLSSACDKRMCCTTEINCCNCIHAFTKEKLKINNVAGASDLLASVPFVKKLHIPFYIVAFLIIVTSNTM